MIKYKVIISYNDIKNYDILEDIEYFDDLQGAMNYTQKIINNKNYDIEDIQIYKVELENL